MEEQLGTGSGLPPHLRVSDAERDRAAGALAKACSEGRLTLDEFSQRVEVVLLATTQSDIDGALADLPRGDAIAYKSPLPETGWLVGVLSGSDRKGRWRPKAKMKALALMGGINIDFRNAVIEGPAVTITAISFMGGIDIVVPEGVSVHVGGFAFMGGKSVRLAEVPVLPGAPVINVRAFPIMGGVSVRTKRSRSRLIDAVHQVLPAHGDPAAPQLGGRSAKSKGAKANRQRNQVLGARDALALATEILDQLAGRGYPVGTMGSSAPSRPRLAPDGTVTILFSDISGFTEITEQLGDGASQELLATYFGIVRAEVSAHAGYEVKCHGDEAMLAFSGAGQAVRCAIDIQRSLVTYNEQHPGATIRVHIGLHTGEAIQDRGDFLGRTVILASRITDEAEADEIPVSSLLHELTAASADLSFASARTVSLQGVSDPQVLYPVRWS
jgi:class 3 adenylate cyclase